MLAFSVAPFAWQVVTALKPESELAQLPPLLPIHPTLEHFSGCWPRRGFCARD